MRGTSQPLGVCTRCTWSHAYEYLWPDLTPDEAVAIATFCLPPDVVEFAARAGFSVAEVLAGVLTPEVIATLPVAAALARKARY